MEREMERERKREKEREKERKERERERGRERGSERTWCTAIASNSPSVTMISLASLGTVFHPKRPVSMVGWSIV